MSADTGERRCQGITRSGQPCRRYAATGSTYCHAHQPSASPPFPAPRSAAVPVTNDSPPPAADPLQQQLKRLRQYVAQLSGLSERLQTLRPGFRPPALAQHPLAERLRQVLDHLLPASDSDSILGQLRGAISEEGLDKEALQGIWYMLNYSLQYQAGMVKRRFTGEYETDPWGLDWEFLDAVRPFLSFMYSAYWRVETSGLAHVPDYGRGLLVSNHSGQIPFDAAMIEAAILTEHPTQRLVRALYADWFATLPFVSILFDKTGQALAHEENVTRLLHQNELVAVFPEGFKGGGKLFKDRYKLARFGRGGFVRAALQTQAPIIPVSVVGAEETYISLHKSKTLARLTGFPYFPISPTFPWLGLLGALPLPTKWYIDFGEPLTLSEYAPAAADDVVLVTQMSQQVRRQVQQMIYHRLAHRDHLFK